MEWNKKLIGCVLYSLTLATLPVDAQQNPNGNAPAFSVGRTTFITTATGIGLGYPVPRPDYPEDPNGVIQYPPDAAVAVYVWGFRGSGQQGNGVHSVRSDAAPGRVNGLPPIASLTGGAYHLVALGLDGTAWGWGQTGYGETGCKTGGYALTPCPIKFDAPVTYVDAGEYFSMALTNKGDVYTWGHNTYGQLGNGNAKNTHIPSKVNLNGEKARVIGAAYEGGFAVTEDNHVWAWGDNEASGLGFQGPSYGVQKIIRTPTHITNLDQYAKDITYIAGGNGWGEALLRNGTVIGWGLRASLGQGTTKTNDSSPTPVVITTDVDHMHARYVGTTALKKDGTIVTWGQTGGSAFPMIYGASPTVRKPIANDPVIAVGGGKEHLFYRTKSGRLFGVGYNDLNKLDQSKCCAPIIDWPGVEIKNNL